MFYITLNTVQINDQCLPGITRRSVVFTRDYQEKRDKIVKPS